MATNPSNPTSTPAQPNAKPTQTGPNSKLYIRMQNVARYRVSGRFSEARVAEMVGLTPSGLASLVKNPDYIEIENALLEGRLSSIDEQLSADIDAKKEVMRRAVPAALSFLVEGVLQRKDLRTALACAKTIIENDPDKTFASSIDAGKGNGGGGMEDAPTLPGDIVASLAVQGNKVIAEIKTSRLNSPSSTSATISKALELEEPKGNA